MIDTTEVLDTAAESEVRLLREGTASLRRLVIATRARSDARARRWRWFFRVVSTYMVLMSLAVTFFAVQQYQTAAQQRQTAEYLDQKRQQRDDDTARLRYATCSVLIKSEQTPEVQAAEDLLDCALVLSGPMPQPSDADDAPSAVPGAAGQPTSSQPSPSALRSSTTSSPAVGGASSVVPGASVVTTATVTSAGPTVVTTTTPPPVVVTSSPGGVAGGIVCPVSTALPVLGPILC